MANPINSFGKIPATLLALVFAFGFTAGGVVAGILPMYKQLTGWWQATAYVPVPARVVSAELESHRGSKSTTYLARAEFSYEYQGQRYLSHSVNFSDGGGDNIGNYQQDTYAQLRQARNDSATVTLWVDPRQPEQAVYDRQIRWLLVAIMLPFAVLFPAVGMGACWMIWRIWRKKEPQDDAATASDGSRLAPAPDSPLLIQGDGGGLRSLLIGSIFWNLISWPLALLFFADAKAAPWWAALLLSIFPAVGLVLIAMTWRTMRAQRRIGKPVLALTDKGVAGSVPLQGEIIFNPAFATHMDTAEMSHAVNVSLECIREDRHGKNSSISTLWHGEALQAQVLRGTQNLKFKIDLPESLPAYRQQLPVSGYVREYWQVVLDTLGGKVKFTVPVSVAKVAEPAALQQSQPADRLLASASKIAGRVNWAVRAITYLFIGYFLWVAIVDFAIPMYQSSQNNSPPDSPSMPQAGASASHTINAPFLLDSLSGNGFGVVARAAGRMEIGDSTVSIYPDSIELRSFGTCAPNCPSIPSVEFMLSKNEGDHFSVVATSAAIPVLQNLPDAGSLMVNVPAEKLPLVLKFADRRQLNGLRLTLAINGAETIDGEKSEVYWYTHAEPFAAALRRNK